MEIKLRKPISSTTIRTGAARREGRQPSHDGECVTCYYVPGGDGTYLVEDNAGVSWSSYDEGEADDISDEARETGADDPRELEAEARDDVARDRGEPIGAVGDVATVGGECANIMVQWGWAEWPAEEA